MKVELNDQNDNKPTFQMETCEVTLKEDLSDLALDLNGTGNHFIGLPIIATDEDISKEFSSLSIVYGLPPLSYDGLKIMTILDGDKTRGELYIERGKFPFDFETAASYNIQVNFKFILHKCA